MNKETVLSIDNGSFAFKVGAYLGASIQDEKKILVDFGCGLKAWVPESILYIKKKAATQQHQLQ